MADFYATTGPAVIHHHNITRVTDIFANVASGYDAGSVAAEIERRLQESDYLNVEQKHDERGTFYDLTGDLKGYSFKLKGETETMRNAFYQFGTGLGIAVVLIYLAMVAQLRSFSVPFIIVLSIPLGFIGVVAGVENNRNQPEHPRVYGHYHDGRYRGRIQHYPAGVR